MNRLKIIALTFCAIPLFTACKKEEKTPDVTGSEAGYFSVIQFTKDQLATYWGQPFTLVKTVTLNGKTDSTIEQADRMDWASIFKIFFAADISNPKFLDQYRFTAFEDDATDSKVFYYEAIKQDLFTRVLQISVDPVNNKIRNIYIETSKKSTLFAKAQKLYYTPLKLIQIQEKESGTGTPDRDLRVEYRFLY